jgi:hypothetical protein
MISINVTITWTIPVLLGSLSIALLLNVNKVMMFVTQRRDVVLRHLYLITLLHYVMITVLVLSMMYVLTVIVMENLLPAKSLVKRVDFVVK